MATVIQSVLSTATDTSDTLTFSSAVTNGNYVLVGIFSLNNTISSCTWDGSAMTNDLNTFFNKVRFYSYKATNGTGTDVVVSVSASSEISTVALEVSGLLDTTPLDATTAYASSAEGSATSHTIPLTNTNSNVFGFGIMRCGSAPTWSATGSETAGGVPSNPDNNGFVYVDGLGSGSQTMGVTINFSSTISVAGVSYQTAGAGGSSPSPIFQNYYSNLLQGGR